MADNDLRCIGCGKTDKSVTLTTTPDRRDYKMFARCPDCYDKRFKNAQQTMNRYPESFMGSDPFDDWY
jgi:hypothetical protein